MVFQEVSDPVTKTRVLIVDEDWRFTKRLVRAFCTQTEVQIVTHGHHVIDQIEHWQPDIIVLDLLLHDIDGFGLLDRLLQLEITSTPFILCVGSGHGALLRLSSDATWPVGIIPRSATPSELHGAIQRAVRYRGGYDPIGGLDGSPSSVPS